MLEIGRVCTKLTGREAGKRTVIIERIDKNFVLVDSPEVKRRRCNVRHLEPTDTTLEIEQGAESKNVEKAFKKAGL